MIGLFSYPLKFIAFSLSAILLSLPTSGAAQNANAGVVSVRGDEIRIEGIISNDVVDSFIRNLGANPLSEGVSLDSPGGRVVPALQIARIIHRLGMHTSVPIGDECHSACSFVFLAGRTRVADGLLGVHQISNVDDPSLTQSIVGEIYEDLVTFNTPSHLVSRMLRTPPSEMYIFTPEELERHSINIRDYDSQANAVPHLLALETWMREDWLVGVFMNTHINKPFVALESREMDPLMRIVNYPHRSGTFVEFMLTDDRLSGTKTRLEMRFGHSDDPSFSLFADADIESNSYAFDLPHDPEQARAFWAAFTAGTDVTVLNGFGVEIGHFSLIGSKRAYEDFLVLTNR